MAAVFEIGRKSAFFEIDGCLPGINAAAGAYSFDMGKRSCLKAAALSVAVICVLSTILAGSARKASGTAPSFDGKGSWLDLVPNILHGLDLIAPDTEEPDSNKSDPDKSGADEGAQGTPGELIEVWNGEEAVSMELEDYITHVVAAEMPASFEPEALKAQAVAARTFAVKHMRGEERCKSGHTICTDHTCCQAFLTTDELRSRWGSAFDKYYSKISAAVNETSGEVIVCDGELITAVYHSSSGGMTENCEAVFAVALPYLVSVESDGEEDSPEFRSVTDYTAEEFVSKVNAAFPQANMASPVGSVDVWDRTDSGRVKLVRLGDTVVTGQQMRDAFKLHSTNFSFEITKNKVTITCLGFGHGVGMSQCGANAMAQDGSDYIEILTHYYTGVDITKFDPNGTGKPNGDAENVDALAALWGL